MKHRKPPPILDSAKVIAYALLDDTVVYTGKATVIVGGKVLDPVPNLAIYQNYKAKDYLLLYIVTIIGNLSVRVGGKHTKKLLIMQN